MCWPRHVLASPELRTCGTSSSGKSLSNFPMSSSDSWPVTLTWRAGAGLPKASKSKGPAGGGGLRGGGEVKFGMSLSPSRDISGKADAARSKSISWSSRRSAILWLVVLLKVVVRVMVTRKCYSGFGLIRKTETRRNRFEEGTSDGSMVPQNDQTLTSCWMLSGVVVCIPHSPPNRLLLFLCTHVPSAELDPRLSRSSLYQVLQREESSGHR
jgi:hypothetical protein